MAKILLFAQMVKGKLPVDDNLVFQTKIEYLRLKCCTLKEDTKINITGSNMQYLVYNRSGFGTSCHPI